MRKKKD